MCCGMGVILRHSGRLEYGRTSLVEDIVGSETTIGLGFTVQQVAGPDKSPNNASTTFFRHYSLRHIRARPLRNSPSLSQPPSLVQAATVTHILSRVGWRPLSDRGKLPSHRIPCSQLRFAHHASTPPVASYPAGTSQDPPLPQRYLLPTQLLPPNSTPNLCCVSPPGKGW